MCVIAYDGFKYINRLLKNSYEVHLGLGLERDPPNYEWIIDLSL